MFKQLAGFVAVATFVLGASSASALTVPVDAPGIIPAVSALDEAVAGLANGVAKMIATIEATTFRFADGLLNGTASEPLSYVAAADAPTSPPSASDQTSAGPTIGAGAPTAPTTTIVSIPSASNAALATKLNSLAAIVSHLASIIALGNKVSATSAQYDAGSTSDIAPTPQQVAADGNPEAIGAGAAVDQLTNTSITTPSINGGSISGATLNGVSGLSTNDLSDFGYAAASDLEAPTSIVAWGDSLTAGITPTGITPVGVNTSYPSQLAALSGYYVYNGGIPGQDSAGLLAKMQADTAHEHQPAIIWTGYIDIHYGPETLAQTEANIASIVALNGTNNYLILGVINNDTGSSDWIGGTNYNNIIALNQYLAATYGSHFIDVRSHLVSLYNPSLPQDVIDHGNDTPPTSLRASDGVHLNAAGYAAVAAEIDTQLSQLTPGLPAQKVATPRDLSYLFSSPPIIGESNPNQGYFTYLDAASGFGQSGTLMFYASTTNHSIAIGPYAGANFAYALHDVALGQSALGTATSSDFNTALGSLTLAYDTSGGDNTAVGYQALYANTTSGNNTAVGYLAMQNNTTGGGNIALGSYTLWQNTTGGDNLAAGYSALQSNTTGSNNVALGFTALREMDVGSGNTAIGADAMYNSTSTTASSNTAVGDSALEGNTTGGSNVAIGDVSLANNGSATSTVAIGYGAGKGTSGLSASQDNVFLGYESDYKNTTGNNNATLGYESGYNISSGSYNIVLGQNVDVVSSSTSQALNVGGVIFGTGLYNGSSVSTAAAAAGKIGIGTTTPYSRFEVWGPDTAGGTAAETIVNSASTTEWQVFDNGNATLAGTLTQNSDQRLKTNIQPLDASSSLALIEQLNPVTFNWIDPDKGTTPQLGFIAQQVEGVFPNLVSTTSPTALTPDGTLSLNYIDLISPIVSAIQALGQELTSLEATVAGFAQSFESSQITATNELCIGSTCINQAELVALLASENQSSGSSSSAPLSNSTDDATDTPPVIHINGDSPAIVQVGASYNDLGATIAGPQADLNLGITTFLNGQLVSNIVLDTSQAATDTIDYVVTDIQGLASTSTRTVIIDSPPAGTASTSTVATSSAAS
jgi:lysophospholipase L1-like esterase